MNTLTKTLDLFVKKFYQPSANNATKEEMLSYYQESKRPNISNIDAYTSNPIVNRCINIISDAVASNKFITNDKVVEDILKRPNKHIGAFEFFKKLTTHKLVYGQSFCDLEQGENGFSMNIIHPKYMEALYLKGKLIGFIKSAEDGSKCKYSYNHTSKGSILKEVMRWFFSHPSYDEKELSPISSAKTAIELHTEACKWSCSLLANGARPSGALVIKDPMNFLRKEQFDRLKRQLEERYSGSHNAGRPMLLEGGIEWQEMSFAPKDLDFIASRDAAAREIATAFGVPTQILNMKNDATYHNMQEARISLFEDTIIPMLDNLCSRLSAFFSYSFDKPIEILYDANAISALSYKRHSLFDSLSNASFLTNDEKRSMIGF
jgi:HK97 family phage portal protein